MREHEGAYAQTSGEGGHKGWRRRGERTGRSKGRPYNGRTGMRSDAVAWWGQPGILEEHFADAFSVVDSFDGFCEEGGYRDHLNFI